MKRIIETKDAPAAVGPYSQAVENNNMLFISGQIPVNPETGKMVEGDLAAQTEQVFRNISSILSTAGYSFSEVVKTTCMLTDMADFKTFNEVYARYYTEKHPARATFAVKGLPLGALIEIETIAMK